MRVREGGGKPIANSSHVKHIQRCERGIVQPGLDLDIVEQFGPDREEIPKQRPEGGPGGLTGDPPNTYIDTTLWTSHNTLHSMLHCGGPINQDPLKSYQDPLM